MSYQLTDLLNDARLDRLFSSEMRACALQLWVLRVEHEGSIDCRVIYGRLLPYSFARNQWVYSDKDTFQSFGSFRAGVTKLSLYLKSDVCRNFLIMACNGETINSISKALNLGFDDKFRRSFGDVKIIDGELIFRPARYLPNRDSHLKETLLSPHGSASAISASISVSNKQSLFRCNDGFNIDFTSMIVNSLNVDTGMNFGLQDVSRFGDVELLVFPSLDDNECNLLNVTCEREQGFKVCFVSTQAPVSGVFEFNFTGLNNNDVVYSRVSEANFVGDGIFEYVFEMHSELIDVIDCFRVDVFLRLDDLGGEGELFCSLQKSFINEISWQMNIEGNNSPSVKFDWLEKTTKSKMANRVAKALSFSFNNVFSKNTLNLRKVDVWKPVNNV
ncbi:MAG: VPA1262 family N-terminal domain-containing protein, partial [Turicibacter sp.]